jgi:hypothetical protein
MIVLCRAHQPLVSQNTASQNTIYQNTIDQNVTVAIAAPGVMRESWAAGVGGERRVLAGDDRRGRHAD